MDGSSVENKENSKDYAAADDKGALRSAEFNDVYFSAVDGLAETRHVFLDCNDLPQGWAGKEQFVICETGFGTGLNFLAVWKLFEETAVAGQKLHFISFEKFPLEPDIIREALQIWADDLGDRIDRLADIYPLRVPGFHRMDVTKDITLSLIFGDVNEEMAGLQADVDCWFLDGSRQSSNSDMWSAEVFSQMARLSVVDASFATFTSAGFVKRGLQQAGFEIQKVKGFGRKREMLRGRYAGIVDIQGEGA